LPNIPLPKPKPHIRHHAAAKQHTLKL